MKKTRVSPNSGWHGLRYSVIRGERRKPRTLSILYLLCILISLASTAHAGEKPSPLDTRTSDILKDITAAAPTSRPTTIPVPVKTAAPQSDFQRWLDLTLFSAPSLATAAAIGIAGGICGLLILLRREALLALALPQVVAVGGALGLRMEWPTLPPALVTAAAALIYLIIIRRRHGRAYTDTALPAIYISALSLSFLIIAGAGAHLAELQNLFTGIDVAVTPARAWTAAPILLAIALILAISWRRWLLVAQAPAAAELAGVSPARWDGLFLLLVTIIILLGTSSQGVVMVLAMLFLPAATVLPWARRIPTALAASAVLSIVMVAAAHFLSNEFSWPLSQSAGGVGFVLLILSNLIALIFK